MSFKYDYFKIELKEKTRITFIGCTKKLDTEEISGFALYSDNSAMTVSVSCNTHKHLKEMQEAEEGFDEYYKWTPGEWKYELINSKEFQNLCTLLSKAHFDVNSAAFLIHRNKIYTIAVEVLEELKNENLFKKMGADFVLMFGVSDFSETKLEIEFNKRLNTQELASEFEKWILAE